MARHRRRGQEEETTYWLSYSDMMASLLLVFVLIISFTMLQSKKQYELQAKEYEIQKELIQEQKKIMEQQQERLDGVIGVKSNLIADLKEEFENTDLKVSVDSQTGAITFDASILFDVNKYELKDSGKNFLKEFLPHYLHILLQDDYESYISEIIIEGHTDTNGTYMHNLQLSQERALSVATFCLEDGNTILPSEEKDRLRSIVTANGRSFSDPIYGSDGTMNLDASRRVEFKFRLKDEEMVNEMIKILAE